MEKAVGLLLLIVCVSLSLTAQEKSILTSVVELKENENSLEFLIGEISSQLKVDFSYGTIPLTAKIKLERKHVTVKEILDAFRKIDVHYKVQRGQIILRKGFSSKHTVSGYVREAGSGETLIGVNVYNSMSEAREGTVSNQYGFYSLTMPAGDTAFLSFSYVGFAKQILPVPIHRDQVVDVALTRDMMLNEVVIQADEEKASESLQMSSVNLPVAQIKNAPALLGEKDVFKVLQFIPGVKSGREGSSGLYVRGGGPDQNLILLDDAAVYNASHVFGFLSVFNGDALKDVELVKGAFPARYGGRLSSVVKLTMKEGNKEKFHGEGGIGLMSSQLTFEGPIAKKKSSFLISARRTYFDLLSRPFGSKDQMFRYHFYDVNAKVNYDFGRRNKLFLSGYFGKDVAKTHLSSSYFNGQQTVFEKSDGGFHWGNATGTLRWNHVVNERLFSNVSLIVSDYRFALTQSEESSFDFFLLRYHSGIRDYTIKNDWNFFLNSTVELNFGFLSTHHRFTPEALVLKDKSSGDYGNRMVSDVVENAVYVEGAFSVSPKLKLNSGLRLTNLQVEGLTYLNLEPRLSWSYRVRKNIAVKAAYTVMNQFMHLLSNTGIGMPTDLWVPITDKVRPQRSQQLAVGFVKDFDKRNLTLTAEGYYKTMSNILAYKDGATFLNVEEPSKDGFLWEEKVTTGSGRSFGVELFLQKNIGRFSGWIGYTLSWTTHHFDSLNFGKKFYARHDRRHDISLVASYKLSDRITLSGNWVFGTGNAITLPVAKFASVRHQPGSKDWVTAQGVPYPDREEYTGRNSFRMPAYHRLDFGIQFWKIKKWGERSWEIGAYNLYNRSNPYAYRIQTTINSGTGASTSVLRQMSLFKLIPSVSYHFKF